MAKARREATVRGTAHVAPVGTHVRMGNENNMSANATLPCEVHLKPLSADDGAPVDTSLQKVRADLPGWLIYVFRDAGSADGTAAGLPEMIPVVVAIGVESRRVATIDVDRAIADCQPYREYGLDVWKHSESVLAPIRNAISLPKRSWRVLKRVPGEVREAFGSLRSDDGPPKPGWKPEEVVELRRTAKTLALRYELHPDEYPHARTAALTALPLHVQSIQAGAIHPDDFEALVMQAEVATTITADEAAEFRRRGAPGTPPTAPPVEGGGEALRPRQADESP